MSRQSGPQTSGGLSGEDFVNRMDRNNDGFLGEDEAPKGPPPRHR